MRLERSHNTEHWASTLTGRRVVHISQHQWCPTGSCATAVIRKLCSVCIVCVWDVHIRYTQHAYNRGKCLHFIPMLTTRIQFAFDCTLDCNAIHTHLHLSLSHTLSPSLVVSCQIHKCIKLSTTIVDFPHTACIRPYGIRMPYEFSIPIWPNGMRQRVSVLPKHQRLLWGYAKQNTLQFNWRAWLVVYGVIQIYKYHKLYIILHSMSTQKTHWPGPSTQARTC